MKRAGGVRKRTGKACGNERMCGSEQVKCGMEGGGYE